MMILTGWKNGKNWETAGYGLKISCADRDRIFRRSQKRVRLILEMPGGKPRFAEANINKASFWNGTCREMISKDIRA